MEPHMPAQIYHPKAQFDLLSSSELHWNDSGLHSRAQELINTGGPLEYSFFFAPDSDFSKALKNAEDLETVQTVLTTAAGLAKMIPEVGSAISASFSLAAYMTKDMGPNIDKHQIAINKAVQNMESKLKDYIKTKNYNHAMSVVETMNDEINKWTTDDENATGKRDIFRRPEMKDCFLMETTAHTMITNCCQDLLAILKDLRKDYVWGDMHNVSVYIALFTYVIHFQQLGTIIDANLATMYEAQNDAKSAKKWRDNFVDGLKSICKLIDDHVNDSITWIGQKQVERRMKQDLDWFWVGDQFPPTAHWKFRDFDNRDFEVTCDKYDMLNNYDVPWQSISDAIGNHMKLMHAAYKLQLLRHTERHFDILWLALDSWSAFEQHLMTYLKKLTPTTKIDGGQLYKALKTTPTKPPPGVVDPIELLTVYPVTADSWAEATRPLTQNDLDAIRERELHINAMRLGKQTFAMRDALPGKILDGIDQITC